MLSGKLFPCLAPALRWLARVRPPFAWVFLLPLTVSAVSLEPLSIPTLTEQADLVLRGTVLSRTVQRDPAGRIYTQIELSVADVWKGAISGTPFLLVHGGGVLGEKQATVSGQASYELGEEVVVFLVRNQRGEGVTVGLLQGKFRVWKDTANGTKYVSNPFHGGASGGSIAAARPATPRDGPRPLSLEDLRKQVVEALR